MNNKNWKLAEKHLNNMENSYKKLDVVGELALMRRVNPAKEKYLKGDRSNKLYGEIMRID
jgi:hypothetical protein